MQSKIRTAVSSQNRVRQCLTRPATSRRAAAVARSLAAAGFASLFSGNSAHATDHYWNAGSGDFSFAANWDVNTVPGGGDNAFINVAGTATITADVASSGN